MGQALQENLGQSCLGLKTEQPLRRASRTKIISLKDDVGCVSRRSWTLVQQESVAPPSVAPWVKIEERDWNRRGQTCLSASGDRLPNLGEKKLEVTTSDGQAATATYQVADVTGALCAVSRMCDKGNTVTFQAEGGSLEPRWRSHSL